MKLLTSKEALEMAMVGRIHLGICVKCEKEPTKEGHDGCIGTLPRQHVMNACCGHGNDSRAYVQRWTRRQLHGKEAIDYINENKSI